jgi:putative nucleotidyltransferase with HDIG domain
MIDLNNARIVFDKFITNYDISNPFIKIKYDHTLRVMDNCKKIAESISLSEEEKDLATLIGLLHDVGRFEQVRLFGILDDRKIDHAELGITILFDRKLIREFISDIKYDNLIKECIYYHDQHQVADSCDENVKLFSKILRDADKIDIYKVMIDAECFDYNVSEMPNEKVLDSILNERSVDLNNVYNTSDWRAVPFGYIYDISFPYSLDAIRDNDYYNKYINRLIIKDSNIKEILEKAKNIGNEYIAHKIL